MYEIHGTHDSQGRRQIIQSGQKPPLGTRHIGLYYIIQISAELTVLWDSSLRVHIIAEDSLRDGLCGMCGNNNGLVDDDLQVPDGSLATSGTQLGEKWRASPKKCPGKPDEYCLARDQMKSAFAIEACKPELKMFFFVFLVQIVLICFTLYTVFVQNFGLGTNFTNLANMFT